MGGGGFLQNLIQGGAGGAGGVRGGGLTPDIVPSATPAPLPSFPASPPLPPPRPNIADASPSNQALNYGTQSPQQNAIQLAFGQSVIDPFTGAPVPAPSATGNSAAQGATPMGMAAAAAEMSKAPAAMAAQPTALAGQGGTPTLAGGTKSYDEMKLAGASDADIFQEIAQRQPPVPLPPPAPGRKPQMPETPLGLPTDRFTPFGEHPRTDFFALPPGSQVPSESPQAELNDWLLVNPRTGQAVPAPQPPGNQMIRRPPAVPRPGIDILTPPPREDRPSPLLPPDGRPTYDQYRVDPWLGEKIDPRATPKPPPGIGREGDERSMDLLYGPSDRGKPQYRFPNQETSPELFPETNPNFFPELWPWNREQRNPNIYDDRAPLLRKASWEGVEITRSPNRPPDRVQEARNDNRMEPGGPSYWNPIDAMHARGPGARFFNDINLNKNRMTPFDILDRVQSPIPPANRNIAPPALKPVTQGGGGGTQYAMADIPGEALSYATATDAAQNAPPEDTAVPRRTIGQQIQEYFNPLTGTIDRVIKTPEPSAKPAGSPPAGEPSPMGGSIAERLWNAMPSAQDVGEYFRPLTEPLANAVQTPLPEVPRVPRAADIVEPGPRPSPYSTATDLTGQLTPAFHPTGKALPGEPLPTNLAVSEAFRPGSPAQRTWDWLTGVPERQGPPVPTEVPPAVAAAGATPGARETYQLPPTVEPSLSQQLGPARPVQTIHIDPQGNITYGTRPPAAPAPQDIPAPQAVPVQARPAPAQGPLSQGGPAMTPRPLVSPTVQVSNQPKVRNPDGSISTVATMGIHDDQGYVNIPMVSKSGKMMTPDEAVREYQNTGGHLGVYKSQAEADRAAELLHQSEEQALPPERRSESSLRNYMAQAYGFESGGRNEARNPRSTAAGKGQFIESTWLATVDAAAPGLASKMSREEKLALRHDPDWMDSMMMYHTKYNVGKLEEKGIPPTNANVFALHRLGTNGGLRVIQNPDRPIASIVGRKAVALNPDLRQTGRSWLRQQEARLGTGLDVEATGSVGQRTSVADDPDIRGTEQPEVLEAARQRFQALMNGDEGPATEYAQLSGPQSTPVTRTREPPASTQPPPVSSAAPPPVPSGSDRTPGGRIIPKVTPNVAEPAPAQIPGAKIDTSKVREVVRDLTPAQVVRQTDRERLWGRLAGIFGGMANGRTWGDMMMGGAAGGTRARSAEATEDRRAAQETADRDYQYRARQAQAEIDIATRYDVQNQNQDINAANTNAENAYKIQEANRAAATTAANTNEVRRAEALNAEREEAKPKVTVTDKGIATTRYDPLTGGTDITYAPNPIAAARDVDDEFKRDKHIADLLGKDDAASQATAYRQIAEKYGTGGVKLQMLGDLAQNDRYMSVLGGYPKLIERLKAVSEQANKLIPAEQRITDPKGAAAMRQQMIKDELIRLYQGGQLGEGWIKQLQDVGHPGAMLLQRSAQSAPDARRDAEPSGLGQGAAFGQ